MKILMFSERLSVHKARTAVTALECPLLNIEINSDMKSALDRPPVHKERNLFVTNTQTRAAVYIPYSNREPNFRKSSIFHIRGTRINMYTGVHDKLGISKGV
jgi:hypothetical protein